jgi:hypothetical protein
VSAGTTPGVAKDEIGVKPSRHQSEQPREFLRANGGIPPHHRRVSVDLSGNAGGPAQLYGFLAGMILVARIPLRQIRGAHSF